MSKKEEDTGAGAGADDEPPLLVDIDSSDSPGGGGNESKTTTGIETTSHHHRRQLVKSIARDAWHAYARHAWPSDILQPARQRAIGKQFGAKSGFTLIASMSTLWIMGLVDEFNRCKQWLLHSGEFSFTTIDQDVIVWVTVIEYIGGLLSCHALTGDAEFLSLAKQIADVIEPAYQRSPTGLPHDWINPARGNVKGVRPFLSQITGGLLEYQYLSAKTGDQRYVQRMERIVEFLLTKQGQTQTNSCQFMERINLDTGEWISSIVSFSWTSAYFYADLLKAYVVSMFSSSSKSPTPITSQTLGDLYFTTMDQLERSLKLIAYTGKGLVYARDQDTTTGEYKCFMDYGGCLLGGMFALGAYALMMRIQNKPEPKSQPEFQSESRRKKHSQFIIARHFMLAGAITDTLQQASARTRTGLIPDRFYFDDEDEATNSKSDGNKRNYFSPELAETYFLMWRITRDTKYREYAWQMVQAIHTHCRVVHCIKNDTNMDTNTDTGGGASGGGGGHTYCCTGYTAINDVDVESRDDNQILDYQSPRLLGGTLKYLYLIFCDDDDDNDGNDGDQLLPLDKWIFNARGHPLPID